MEWAERPTVGTPVTPRYSARMPRDTWWNLPEEKRARITEAAMHEFGSRGFSAGSLNVIAREAGVAKGSLFQYFADKLDFFAAMSEEVTASIRATVVGQADLSGGYFGALRSLVPVWLRFYREHPVAQRMSMAVAMEVDAEARAAVRSVSNRAFAEVLRPMAEAAEQAGELREGVDLDQLVSMTVLLLRHLNSAPFAEHIDPVLGLPAKSDAEVEEVCLGLIGALERAFAR